MEHLHMKTRTQQIEELNKEWTQPRWEGITRPYSAEEVVKLRGSVNPECTLAQLGAAKMWRLLHGEAKKGYINSLGALTGGQALQQAKAGIEAIYLSGWQVAADANLASSMYPDQSLYPANSVPAVVDRINNTFRRADQIQWSAGIEPNDPRLYRLLPADRRGCGSRFWRRAERFELMKSMIEAGAAAVHFEDQLASVKKCGHMGGKVLVPTQEAIQKLVAARLAADVMGVPTLVIARTDADAADLITSDCDPYDSEFITGERTSEGFFRTHAGIEQAISRGLAYAPYADLVWCETSTPDLALAKRFADAIHAKYPGKLLAYNCSPSFNWQKNLDDKTIASFQQQLSDMGYKYQFITPGIHSMWFNMFDLAHAYAQGEA
jgi:isocitrate lyase